MIRGGHVKNIRIKIRYFHLLKISSYTTLVPRNAKRARAEAKSPRPSYPELPVLFMQLYTAKASTSLVSK